MAGDDDHAATKLGPIYEMVLSPEMATARAARVPFVGVKETDVRHCLPDFAEEKSRGRQVKCTCASENLRLLDEICFIPYRRELHEIDGMMNEIGRQMLDKIMQLPVFVYY